MIQATLFDEARSSAVISGCGRYRYRLDRRWRDGADLVCFVMLNPSTADGTENDPTLRRCMAYAKGWGYDGLVVVNLFAWRATDPRALLSAGDAIGDPAASEHIRAALSESSLVICGWGSSGKHPDRSRRIGEVVDMIERAGLTPMALAVTKDGAPRHPLYLRADLTPTPWSAP